MLSDNMSLTLTIDSIAVGYTIYALTVFHVALNQRPWRNPIISNGQMTFSQDQGPDHERYSTEGQQWNAHRLCLLMKPSGA